MTDDEFNAIYDRMRKESSGKVIGNHSEKEFNVFHYKNEKSWFYWNGDYEIRGPFKSEEEALRMFDRYIRRFVTGEMVV
jgi:hypothetical protein